MWVNTFSEQPTSLSNVFYDRVVERLRKCLCASLACVLLKHGSQKFGLVVASFTQLYIEERGVNGQRNMVAWFHHVLKVQGCNCRHHVARLHFGPYHSFHAAGCLDKKPAVNWPGEDSFQPRRLDGQGVD